MPKVTIMQDGMSKRAYIDGKNVSNVTKSIDVRILPDEVPTATFETNFIDGFIELCQANAMVIIHPNTLQEAAVIIRQELLRKDDWYDALVASIKDVASNFHGRYNEDVTFEFHKGEDEALARKIADQIIGIEVQDGSN